jgi:hypothetical protein
MSDATPSAQPVQGRVVRLWVGAAIVIGVVTLLFWSVGDGVDMAAWQREALRCVKGIAGGQTKLDRESPDPGVLVAWLQEQQAPVLPTLPDALASARAIGGRTWQWRGLKFAARRDALSAHRWMERRDVERRRAGLLARDGCRR